MLSKIMLKKTAEKEALKIIKYEGDNATFVWKHPSEDFNTTSQLIVHESQEALFFMNGQALDLFGPGRHTLETQNIPLIRNIINIPTGGKTPFHCEVYFINRTQQMAIKWGTDSQVQYMEPTYHFPLQIGACGEMILSVENSRKLLIKIVGTEKRLSQKDLVLKFRALLMSKIKPYIAKTMQEADFSIFEVDAHMNELSEELHKLLVDDFDEFGINLDKFYVSSIARPEGDPAYEQFKRLHIRQYTDITEAKLRQELNVIESETAKHSVVVEAEGMSEKRRLEEYSYGQERGFDVAEKVAENEGVGNFSSLGIGLGMLGGVAGGVAGVMGGITGDAMRQVQNPAEQQNPAVANNVTDNMEVFKQKIEKLMMMKEMGLLTDEEFNQQKLKLMELI